MKILFVAPAVPAPYGGGALRMYSQLTMLAASGVSIDLVCSAAAGEEVPGAVRRAANKVYVCESPPESPAARLRNLLALRAYSPRPEMAELVRRLLRENSYDLVHAHKFQAADCLKGLAGTPVVVDLWACGLSGAWNDFLRERRPARKAVKLTRLPRLYLADRELYRAFDNFFVVSAEAAAYVNERYPGKRVFVVPHGTVIPPVPAEPGAAGPELVFVGDMSFSPNVDTVLYFTEQIYPELKRRFPGVRFRVVGRDPAPEVSALGADPSIEVTGFVPDPGVFLSRAAVFVAPIRTGLGLRTKLLEAFAWGLPVVTTRAACEGTGALSGRDLLLAEGPADHVEKISLLLRSPEKRRELGRNARDLALRSYSWGAITAAMKGHYDDILGNSHL